MKADSALALMLIAMVSTCSGGCGGETSTTPTQPTMAQVAGTWQGTMRATSVVGQCAPILQYMVGGTSQFTVRLTQAGSSLAGTVELDGGTCDVTGSAGQNTITLATTVCRAREIIFFFVCEGSNAEFVVHSLNLEATITGPSAAGKYTYSDDIRMPVGGPVAGVLTQNGDASMSRQ